MSASVRANLHFAWCIRDRSYAPRPSTHDRYERIVRPSCLTIERIASHAPSAAKEIADTKLVATLKHDAPAGPLSDHTCRAESRQAKGDRWRRNGTTTISTDIESRRNQIDKKSKTSPTTTDTARSIRPAQRIRKKRIMTVLPARGKQRRPQDAATNM